MLRTVILNKVEGSEGRRMEVEKVHLRNENAERLRDQEEALMLKEKERVALAERDSISEERKKAEREISEREEKKKTCRRRNIQSLWM